MKAIGNGVSPYFRRGAQGAPALPYSIYSMIGIGSDDDSVYFKDGTGKQNRDPEPGRGIAPQGTGYLYLTSVYTPIDSVWELDYITPVSLSGTDPIFSFADSSGNAYGAVTDGTSLRIFRNAEAYTIPISVLLLSTSTKYRFKIVYKGTGTPDVYINDLLLSYTPAWGGLAGITASHRSIGAYDNALVSPGELSNVKIWNASGELIDQYNLEEQDGDVAYSSVERWNDGSNDFGANHMPVINRPANFWMTDNQFSSEQNDVGYSLVGGVNLPNVIDKDNIVQNIDTSGDPIDYPGRVAYNLRVDSPVGVFNRTDDLINFGDLSALDGMAKLTIVCEYRHQAGAWAIREFLVSKSILSGVSDSYNLGSGAGAFFRVSNGIIEANVDMADPTSEVFHKTVGTYNGVQIELFHNAVSQGTDPLTGNVNASIRNFKIGGSDSGVTFFGGNIKQVYIYDYDWTPAQINAFQNENIVPSDFLLGVTPSGLQETEYDISGNGNHGAWAGTGSRTANSPYGTAYNLRKGFTENLICDTAGVAYDVQEDAYGVYEFEINKGSSGTSIEIAFISTDNAGGSGTGYKFFATNADALKINRTGLQVLMDTGASYISPNIKYGIKIVRNLTTDQYITGAKGTFGLYIKGGAFGSSYILVDVSGGSGSNPVTSDVITSSNYFVIDNTALDEIRNIRVNDRYISPREFTVASGAYSIGEIPALSDGSADATGGEITNIKYGKGSNLATMEINKDPFDAPALNNLPQYLICNVNQSVSAEVPAGTVIGDITFEDGDTGVSTPTLLGTTLTFALLVGEVISKVYAGDTLIPLVEFWTSSQYDDGTDHTADVSLVTIDSDTAFEVEDLLPLADGWDFNNWTGSATKTRNSLIYAGIARVEKNVGLKAGFNRIKIKGVTSVAVDFQVFQTAWTDFFVISAGEFDIDAIVYVGSTADGRIAYLASGAGTLVEEDLYIEWLSPLLEFERKFFDNFAQELGSIQNVSNCENEPGANGYTTFTGATPSGYRVTSDGSTLHIAGTADEIATVANDLFLVTFDLTLNSGNKPLDGRFAQSLGGTARSNTIVPVEGANTHYLIATNTDTVVFQIWNASTVTDYTISNLVIKKVNFGQYGNKTTLRREGEWTAYEEVPPSKEDSVNTYFQNRKI